VGKIDAIGDGVLNWKVGQPVDIGFLGGHCGRGQSCRRWAISRSSLFTNAGGSYFVSGWATDCKADTHNRAFGDRFFNQGVVNPAKYTRQ
jgi:D-arabinose 1-dehydrogenase-like Zn-dependent alcohol dehydrogenase